MQEEDMPGAKYAAVFARHKVLKQHSIPKFSSSKKGGWLDCCNEIRHCLEISNDCEKRKTLPGNEFEFVWVIDMSHRK